jgi:peptidoglycan/LPS O-acetylase OafA/YrhL
MPAEIKRPHYRALDGYRFIAASLIVLHHYNGRFALGLERLTPAVDALPAMVDFFFVLSGFVITCTYMDTMRNAADYGDFLKRRLARILPLHLAVLFMFAVPVVAFRYGWLSTKFPETLEMSAFPANALLLHAWGFVDHISFNPTSWSVSAEWLVYLLFPCFLLLARRFSPVTNLVLIVGGVAAMIMWRNAMGLRPWTEANYDYGALRALPTFFLGMIFAVMLDTSPRLFHALFRAPWLVVHLLFVAAVVSLHFEWPRELSIVLLALVVPFAATAEHDGRPSWLTTDIMARLGDFSYAIYMINIVFGSAVLLVLHKLHLGTPLRFAGAFATYIAVVVVSGLVYRYFESPSRRWVNNAGWRELAFSLRARNNPRNGEGFVTRS